MLQTTTMLQTATWVFQKLSRWPKSPSPPLLCNEKLWALLRTRSWEDRPGQARSPRAASSPRREPNAVCREAGARKTEPALTALGESNLITRASESDPQLLCKQRWTIRGRYQSHFSPHREEKHTVLWHPQLCPRTEPKLRRKPVCFPPAQTKPVAPLWPLLRSLGFCPVPLPWRGASPPVPHPQAPLCSPRTAGHRALETHRLAGGQKISTPHYSEQK